MSEFDQQRDSADIEVYRLAVRQLLEQISKRDDRLKWLQAEQERLHQELAEKDKAIGDLSAQLREREQSIGQLQAEVAQLKAEQERLHQELAEKDKAIGDLSAQLREREQSIGQLQAEVAQLKAEQERLSQRLKWKRYRIADRLIAIYWYIRHPEQAFQFAREHMWQLGRKWLPPPVKAWIKRSILRQSPSLWQPSHGLLSQTENSKSSGELIVDSQMSKTSHYDIVILPIIEWKFRFQRPQQIAKQFAKNDYRVFYLTTSFNSSKNSEDHHPIVRVIERLIAEVQLPGPRELNIYRNKVDEFTLQQWLKAFDRLRQDYGINEAVCLVHLPFWWPLAYQLRERFGWKIVYDCMDEHAGFSTNEEKMLSYEEDLVRGSDLIIVTSRKLLGKQKRYNPRCVLIPNACDFDHFSKGGALVPSQIAFLSKPIIGYYGAISDWFDTKLLAEVARLRPTWSFVLIGNTFGADLVPFRDLANVHLLGEQPYQVLPTYLHAFDVCIIPFKLTPLTEATNPVKFYEYLCAGKPVVSTPLPELVPYEAEGLVYLAQAPKEFVEKIEQALRENTPERIAARQDFAKQNTWEKRFAHLQGVIREVYKKVSIVILTHNNLNLTKQCIESIFRNTLWPNFELIIIDNSSTDGTREYLEQLAQKHENVKLIFNNRNEGFARGNNQGILAATGEYIVLLNNDTIVTRGWLGRLIRHLESDPRNGMVGPVTNSIGNEARIDVNYSSIEEMEAFAARRAREYEGKTFEIKMLALFCAVMRRKLFDEIGLLDERFEVGMFEDDDMAFRVKQVGYRIACCEDVFVHHHHSATFKQFGEQEYMKLFEVNRKKFEEKWGIRWEPHKYREEKSYEKQQ